MARLTSSLEEIANDDDVVGGDDDRVGVDPTSSSRRRRRRLNPPEITFLDAVVSCRYLRGEGRRDRGGGPSTIAEEDDEDDAIVAGMRLDAKGALLEWAEAHRCLGMAHPTSSSTREDDDDRRVHRGVSIVRTADAEIWSNRPRDDDDDDAASTSRDSEFHYDWTFSSPYAGTVVRDPRKTDDGKVTNETTINNRQMWRPLRRSRIPYRMLQDNTQPILLYDDVHLYEDDLHDNGDVSLNAKIRVMPKCWYVLQRLFVRVDRVCVRCREVRYFCSFFDEVGADDYCDTNDDGAVRANTIYRDVTWREAAWEEIGDAGMPTDPAAWREDGLGLGSLLTRLPSAPLPDDIPRFSSLDVNPRMKD
ncbi:hypothetical protein ACHAW5_008271 [Stephanodiscus triporus]|uniref:TIP41-like protein n=1 Tax=Stephanodiscus triporus TaxID=2934178 RepID=A0ABD3MRE5_9STRA